MARSDLVESLAMVAISALSGPLGPVGVTTAQGLLKACKAAWDRASPDRQLWKTVSGSIDAWAGAEIVDADVVDRGLGWAIEYVQAAGSRLELIAEADFDAAQATARVLDGVKGKDALWGTEAEYTVAERAVGATYHALCARLKGDGGVVLAAVQATRLEIRSEIETLRNELVGPATRDDMIGYLRTRIEDWDFSPWTAPKHPSALERQLHMESNDREQVRHSAQDALQGAGMLVVLGGPGSGKSWLAQRYAREAALSALDALRDPRVDPSSVEIPILTTWATWAKHPSDRIDGLVAAALPAEGDVSVRRSVLRRGSRVLAVIDSLDEAGLSATAARTLLHCLPGPPGWRVVVTSRHEAWNTAAPALKPRLEVRTGTLIDLSYPDDVHGFIRQWFSDEPAHAMRLIDQIERRRELVATATVPLLLTFYCMLTEQHPFQDLPWRHRDLYSSIVDQLLTGQWRFSDRPRADLMTTSRALLRDWAWEAVGRMVTPVGLGAWRDQVTTRRITADLDQTVDHIAPKQKHPGNSRYDHEFVERRFLHRTFLEYFVAEHIVTLSAEEAAAVVLPHVWFDRDWEVTLPMVIAGHPNRDDMVDRLRESHSPEPTPAQQVVNNGLDGVLLEAATQSLPTDWNPAHAQLIHRLRVLAVPDEVGKVVRSAHWTHSNPPAIRRIVSILTTTSDPWLVRNLAGALPTLSPTEDDRSRARLVILATLTTTADPWLVHDLAAALPALEPTESERTIAREAILAILTRTVLGLDGGLAGALPALAPTEPERTEVRKAILTILTTTTAPGVIRGLAGVLPALAPTEPERTITRKTILAALSTTRLMLLHELTRALPALAPTDHERTDSRKTILRILTTTTDPGVAHELAGALPALDPTEPERTSARKTILSILTTTTDPGLMTGLARALTTLAPTGPERTDTRQASLAILTTTNPWLVRALAEVLPRLDPTGPERTDARRTILATLTSTSNDPWVIPRLTQVLPALVPTGPERADARKKILAILTTATDPWLARGLAEVLPEFDPPESERTDARQAILDTLTTTKNIGLARELAGVLTALVPTEPERSEARKTILGTLTATAAGPNQVRALAEILSALDPDQPERTSARNAILTMLTTAELGLDGELAKVLLALARTESERTDARQSILTTLNATIIDPGLVIPELVGLLLTLEPTEPDRTDARQTMLRILTTTASLRQLLGLAVVFPALEPTDTELAAARTAILRFLRTTTKPELIRDLIRALRLFGSVATWLKDVDGAYSISSQV